jgi:hypothetical protein
MRVLEDNYNYEPLVKLLQSLEEKNFIVEELNDLKSNLKPA